MSYADFIKSKQISVKPLGFDIDGDDLNVNLFDWQRRIVQWAVRRGRAALFEDTGLGKSLQQLAWADAIFGKTNKPIILHCPLGVRFQTLRESQKFGIKCTVAVVNEQSEVVHGINIVNYEKVEKFDTSTFAGVVLDESSILKNMQGKTKRRLCELYSNTPYRLACTATPSPNDQDELGSHAEFLGVSAAVDMRNRFFYHDSGDTGKWTLMPHARKEFWKWVASWAVCIGKPSDIGGNNDGYDLPPLNTHRHIVHCDQEEKVENYLFNVSGLSATTLHQEKRLTNSVRCRKAAELVNAGTGPCIVWCDTNYEADELKILLPHSIEVRGSESESVKEAKMERFLTQPNEILISKSSIFGFGCNLQHCNRMVFAGLNYSFEQWYQSVRRCWRFGQTKPVEVHIVIADTESAITSAISRKENDFALMRCGMAEAMRDASLVELGLDSGKVIYRPTVKFQLPSIL